MRSRWIRLRHPDEENAMKYEMLMLRSLLVTTMLICGLTLGQMF